MEDRRELDADRAAAHDRDRLRQLRQMDRLVTGDDVLLIDLDARHATRRRPGRDDDLARRERPRARSPVTSTCPLPASRPVPFTHSILCLLEQELDALGEPGHDLVLARVHACHVDRRHRVALAETDAPLGGALRDLQRVRVLEQRLRRDAAPGSGRCRRATAAARRRRFSGRVVRREWRRRTRRCRSR